MGNEGSEDGGVGWFFSWRRGGLFDVNYLCCPVASPEYVTEILTSDPRFC